MQSHYNARSPAVKRLMREAHELSEASSDYYAQPLEDNLFEWHFTVRGPDDSEFEGGIYHGRIILPSDYPMKPPNIIVLTPNGRFEVGKKICLSISGHHPESWQPSWSIRTALLAIIGFMPTPARGTIGSLDYHPDERKRLAKASINHVCDRCGLTASLLKPKNDESAENSLKTKNEAAEIAKTMAFKGEDDSSEAQEEMTEEQKEKMERKRLSLKAQQRFRDKVEERTGRKIRIPGETQKTSKKKSDSGSEDVLPNVRRRLVQERRPSAAGQGRHRARRQQQQNHHWFNDCLILALVFGIILIIIRRFMGSTSGIPTRGGDEL